MDMHFSEYVSFDDIPPEELSWIFEYFGNFGELWESESEQLVEDKLTPTPTPAYKPCESDI